MSGGIDSALVATIAADALGPENVRGVAMPGPYSSEGSLRDARSLAKNLGIELLTLPITETFQSYRQALASRFSPACRKTRRRKISRRASAGIC